MVSGLKGVATHVDEVSFFPDVDAAALPPFAAHTLWPAPIYCWLLLVSGWAPPRAISMGHLTAARHWRVETDAFHTSHFATMVGPVLSATPQLS